MNTLSTLILKKVLKYFEWGFASSRPASVSTSTSLLEIFHVPPPLPCLLPRSQSGAEVRAEVKVRLRLSLASVYVKYFTFHAVKIHELCEIM